MEIDEYIVDKPFAVDMPSATNGTTGATGLQGQVGR